MDLNKILTDLGGIAGQLAGAVTGVGPLMEGAKSVAAAFASIKSANNGQAPADAEAQHDALLAKVNEHADSTLGTLEGGTDA